MPLTAQSEFTPEEVRELRGGWVPLLARVGQPAGLASGGEPAAAWPRARVDSVPALRLFLRAYVTEILLPLELPAIARAFAQAQRNELRELLATTLALGGEARLREFAAASQRVGRAQLQRLRPLTDQRFARRFREAVEQGRALPWHTVVFGVTLAIYSLPLRPGLLHYARQMLGGFLAAAPPLPPLDASAAEEMLAELCGDLSAGVEAVLAANGGGELRVV